MEALMSSQGYSLTENVRVLSSLLDKVYEGQGLRVVPAVHEEVRFSSDPVKTDRARPVVEK